jgi:hypothetical protein
MDDELSVDPVAAGQGAASLRESAQTLAASRGAHGDQLEDEAAGRPWGADRLGQAVQANYEQIAPVVLAAWTRIGTYLDDYAIAVTSIVDAAVAAEDAARQRMTW